MGRFFLRADSTPATASITQVFKATGCGDVARGVCFRLPQGTCQATHSRIQGGEYVYGPESATSLG
jgi:hypothetical protein